jgi:anti-sigma regulatory factor (Ser/Thr protein kinase)
MGVVRGTAGRLGSALAAAAVPAPTALHHPIGLMHTAVRHRTPAELASLLTPFIHEALQVGDPVYVSLPPSSLTALEAELGRDADRVRWTDATRWHPHPMRRLRAIRELVEGTERHGVGRLRLVGGCPMPPVAAMVPEWERFDALLNVALAGMPVTVVCIYDESALPADVVDRAPWSHPLVGLSPAERSSSYLEPERYLAHHRVPPVPVPAGAPSLSGKVTAAAARGFVRRALARSSGERPPVPGDVVEDLALAVTELVTNAWQAGARSVAVTCWRSTGEIGAQVDDDGPGLTDPLAGYRWPDPASERGRGLWLARQLVDVVDVVAGLPGTSVQARAFDATWRQLAA